MVAGIRVSPGCFHQCSARIPAITRSGTVVWTWPTARSSPAQAPAPPDHARLAAAPRSHVGLPARLLLALLHHQVLHGVCVLGCQAVDAALQLPHALLYQRCPASLAPRQPASSVAAHQLRDVCVAPSLQRRRQEALHAVDDRRRCRR